MRILILGGTQFIGPHVVQALQAAGHDLTIFNRGKTADSLEGVSRLRGDRLEDDVEALRGLSFDATVDLCGYVPRAVNVIFEALADPGFYCFVSTISVYANFGESDQDESSALATLEDESAEEITGETYGGLKVLCEKVVQERAVEHALLRLGLVVGAGDVTDRLTYWMVKASEQESLLVPDSPQAALQWIDVRDVAAFVCRVVESKTTGIFNLTTPARSLNFAALFAAVASVSGNHPTLHWISVEKVEEWELSPWVDFPAWLPEWRPWIPVWRYQ